MKWTRELSFSSSSDVTALWYWLRLSCSTLEAKAFKQMLKKKILKFLLEIVYSLIVYK